MPIVRIAYRRWPALELGMPRMRRIGGRGVYLDEIALRNGAESMFWTKRCVSALRALFTAYSYDL